MNIFEVIREAVAVALGHDNVDRAAVIATELVQGSCRARGRRTSEQPAHRGAKHNRSRRVVHVRRVPGTADAPEWLTGPLGAAGDVLVVLLSETSIARLGRAGAEGVGEVPGRQA
ncbi:hypothetical protein [Saccharopolyspora pogona]|uniref:hypothetical protein n=1 Tax=Saccharopolyspora pogona TaxID=333966 RepID=UPI001685CD21|nr:hypothetical protein [Saccharopolyspora pogona]